MKKFLLLAAIFAVVLTACPTDVGNDNGKGNGNGNGGNGTTTKTTLTISNQSGYNLENVEYASAVFGNINSGKDVTKDVTPDLPRYIFFSLRPPINGDVIRCRTDQPITCDENEQNTIVITINTTASLENGDRKNILKNLYDDLNKKKISFTIKNLSSIDITDVTWQGVSFASSQAENAIKAGATVTNEVIPGSGYILFKRKSTPITARTSALTIITENDAEFTFTDNTVIVERNDILPNLNNSGALGTLQSVVVWFDDAEGSMQPYQSSQSFVGYYNDGSKDLLRRTSDYYDYREHSEPHDAENYLNYYYVPKNGNKSIAIGGTDEATLTLQVNLNKRAKLSFWYANKNHRWGSASVSINNNVTQTFSDDTNWSFIEFNLESGTNTITWEKTYGYDYEYTIDPLYFITDHYYYYLTLDDILIYYTE
jgi:hypothetical protein